MASNLEVKEMSETLDERQRSATQSIENPPESETKHDSATSSTDQNVGTKDSEDVRRLCLKPFQVCKKSPVEEPVKKTGSRSTGPCVTEETTVSSTDDDTGHSIASLPWDDTTIRFDGSPSSLDSQSREVMETEL